MPGAPSPAWSRFFDHLGMQGFNDLNRRAVNLERQVRDNGVTYNVYADADGPQRPWSLDLFPLILTPQSWQQIETGVMQRVRLLDRVMADVYGEQQLLSQGLLPAALVQGHPGAPRHHRVWATCWRTGWPSRACFPRPSARCTCSGWRPATGASSTASSR